ncbi:unnamed protein product, partial [Polarella glacialis]
LLPKVATILQKRLCGRRPGTLFYQISTPVRHQQQPEQEKQREQEQQQQQQQQQRQQQTQQNHHHRQQELSRTITIASKPSPAKPAKPAETSAEAPSRSPSWIYQALCKHIHGTLEGPFMGVRHALPEDHSYASTNLPEDFLQALFERLQPSFLLEIGSFKGGSALRIADAALSVARNDATAPTPCLVCVDTFLGDAQMWLDRNPGWRDGLLLENGFPRLYWQFMANVQRRREVILPLPLASLSATRVLQQLAVRQVVPLPEFVYLDSAHVQGETLMEIIQAFRLLPEGGVLVGDDLDWPAVESDLLAFLQTEPPVTGSEDPLLLGLPNLFFRADSGYWVLDTTPRQWLLRKRAGAGRLSELRHILEVEDYGETTTEYVALTDADREALQCYHEGVALME